MKQGFDAKAQRRREGFFRSLIPSFFSLRLCAFASESCDCYRLRASQVPVAMNFWRHSSEQKWKTSEPRLALMAWLSLT